MTSSPLPLPAGIAPEMLRTVFQPIFRLSTTEVLGYEALLRGPAGTAMESPAALFAAASDTDSAVALETTAARLAIANFSAMRLPGKLFLNFSAFGVRQLLQNHARLLHEIADHDLHPSRIVIELTEQEYDELERAMQWPEDLAAYDRLNTPIQATLEGWIIN